MKKSDPWRFKPGQKVYVRGWPQDQPALILCQLMSYTFPHYFVADSEGAEWRIAQLELSSKPIPTDR